MSCVSAAWCGMAAVEACNKTGLEQCLGARLTLPGLYDQHVNDSVFPVYDDVTLDVMCRCACTTTTTTTST